MNPEQLAYSRKINELRVYVGNITKILNDLIKNCKHLIVCMYDFGGAYCNICGESFGWYCEDSPNKYCEYDWKIAGESCIYCGKPQERK